ncbi:alpha/beta hydrolase [Gordonia sp. CPCC 206044]|uniref:alpha/beta fold hydrolase n=1 Tax=Gordonia sp. CPCC 206044 TaxID=3140793 RepID=UPI003AF34DC6
MPVTPTVCAIDRDDLTLVADCYGESRRGAAVLLHGGGQTRQSWRATAQAIADHGRTAVSMDLRGHGDSGWSASGDYSLDALVEDVAALSQAFPNPVLVGASLGGLMSLTAIGERHISAQGLVLVDVGLHINNAGSARVIEFMRRHADDGFASLDEVADAVAAYNPHRPRPRNLEGLRRNVRLRDNGRWYWHWDPTFMCVEPGAAARFADGERLAAAAQALSVPVLLVRGRESDVLTEEAAAEFLDLVPGAQLVDVGGAGHMVAGDVNDAFTQAVLGFIDAL